MPTAADLLQAWGLMSSVGKRNKAIKEAHTREGLRRAKSNRARKDRIKQRKHRRRFQPTR